MIIACGMPSIAQNVSFETVSWGVSPDNQKYKELIENSNIPRTIVTIDVTKKLLNMEICPTLATKSITRNKIMKV